MDCLSDIDDRVRMLPRCLRDNVAILMAMVQGQMWYTHVPRSHSPHWLVAGDTVKLMGLLPLVLAHHIAVLVH